MCFPVSSAACRIELRTLSYGEMVMTEDSHNDAGLVLVLSGSLELSQCNNSAGGGSGNSGDPSSVGYGAGFGGGFGGAHGYQQHHYGSYHQQEQQRQSAESAERVLYTAYRVRQLLTLTHWATQVTLMTLS